jgi:DNA-binding transcriptional regulator PaaX
VWITPDPVADLAESVRETGLEGSMLRLFNGGVEGGVSPREIAASAWDFVGLERVHQEYLQFARRSLRWFQQHPASAAKARATLREERRLWWRAVQADPLLPRELLPESYSGVQAWELRRELLGVLVAALDRPPAA